jgi:hypothetical protein
LPWARSPSAPLPSEPLAIGRLRIVRGDAEEVHLGTVEIDDLTVRRLHVIEEKPSASRESDAG